MTDRELFRQALEALVYCEALNRDVQRQKEHAVYALRERLAQPEQEFTTHEEGEDGWSDWVCPDPQSYLMKCCDCGLVHEAQFGVVRYKSEAEREDCEKVDDPNLQAVFRMRRSEEWTPDDTAYRPGGLAQPEQYEQAVTDALVGGTGVVLGGKRIDPASIYKKPEQEPVAVRFPRTAGGGWTIDPAFLRRVKHSIDPETHDDFTPDMEEIETTLLALEVIPANLYTTPPRREWYDGAPPFPQDQEWFIAETIYGDRVVLRSLDEGREHKGNYAFTTADGTYMKAENVRRWMQFPDCEYLPPLEQPEQNHPEDNLDMVKARQIAHEYAQPHSGIDAGNLYWALHVALRRLDHINHIGSTNEMVTEQPQPEQEPPILTALNDRAHPKEQTASMDEYKRLQELVTSQGIRLMEYEAEQSPLDRMAENARELGLDYEPVQEPVAIDRLYIEALIEGLYQNEDPVSIDAAEEFERLLKTPASPPASKPWVELTELEALGAYEAEQQGRWGDHVRGLLAVEAKLREKNA